MARVVAPMKPPASDETANVAHLQIRNFGKRKARSWSGLCRLLKMPGPGLFVRVRLPSRGSFSRRPHRGAREPGHPAPPFDPCVTSGRPSCYDPGDERGRLGAVVTRDRGRCRQRATQRWPQGRPALAEPQPDARQTCRAPSDSLLALGATSPADGPKAYQ
jgi:hypothetical protein